MRKTIRLAATAAILAPALLVLGGCRTNAQTGSLIGAGAGALGGYIIGNEMDKDGGSYDDDHDDYRRRRHHHRGRGHYYR